MSGAVQIIRPGPLSTVQDAGRPGLAALGVGRSGAADQRSFRLANRLVGNDEHGAAVEVTFGGLAFRVVRADLVVALAGARCPATVTDGTGSTRGLAHHTLTTVPAGSEVRLGPPETGVRTYLAVRGGLDVPPVLGSRATDLLCGLGPPPLRAGDLLPVGAPPPRFPALELAPVPDPPAGEVPLRIVFGPRADWFTPAAQEALLCAPYLVTDASNRVGMRLDGPPLERIRDDELPSEGLVTGALQVPASGSPVLFLADHPVTGGYPVIACVDPDDVPAAAQARPGQPLRFRLA